MSTLDYKVLLVVIKTHELWNTLKNRVEKYFRR